jgi:hypothetical protein
MLIDILFSLNKEETIVPVMIIINTQKSSDQSSAIPLFDLINLVTIEYPPTMRTHLR